MCIVVTLQDGSKVTIKPATSKKTFGGMSRLLDQASERFKKEVPAKILDKTEFQL